MITGMSINMTHSPNGSLYLDENKMLAVYGILIIQSIGLLSNIICIIIVSQIKVPGLSSRPKIMMANIAVSDTILTLNSIFPRLVYMKLYVKHPLTGHVLQSMRSYMDNLTLYVTSFTFTLIACDRYYAITKIFTNPFDTYSPRLMLTIIWLASGVLSVPFVVTNEVDFYDWTTSTLTCFTDGIYMSALSADKTFMQTTRLFAVIVDFLIPVLLVSWFTALIIYKLCIDYRNSLRGIRVNSDIKRCEVTKRLITVLIIFIVKNSTYYLAINSFSFDFTTTRPSSCDLSPAYYFFYVAFRTTNSFNSIIFFWLSSEFRSQIRNYWSRRRSSTTSSCQTRRSICHMNSTTIAHIS